MTAAPPIACVIGRRRPAAILFFFALAIAGCRSGMGDEGDSCRGGSCPAEVTLTGRLHAVWNGTARWFLVDGQGRERVLSITEEVADGRRLEFLDRRLVTVTGVRLADGTIAVQTIAADSVGAP